MKATPYLNFDGQCAEAFRLYQRVLGGKLDLMTHGDSPIAGEVPGEWHDRVMHVYLSEGDLELMGSDTPPGQAAPAGNVHVALQVDDAAEAERIYNELVDGGQVTMPIQETFWVEKFGMLVDRFGVSWLINGGQGRSVEELSGAGAEEGPATAG